MHSRCPRGTATVPGHSRGRFLNSEHLGGQRAKGQLTVTLRCFHGPVAERKGPWHHSCRPRPQQGRSQVRTGRLRRREASLHMTRVTQCFWLKKNYSISCFLNWVRTNQVLRFYKGAVLLPSRPKLLSVRYSCCPLPPGSDCRCFLTSFCPQWVPLAMLFLSSLKQRDPVPHLPTRVSPQWPPTHTQHGFWLSRTWTHFLSHFPFDTHSFHSDGPFFKHTLNS